jgi:hypothetical protein
MKGEIMTQILENEPEQRAAMYKKRMQRLGKEAANLARCKSREGKGLSTHVVGLHRS